MLHTLKLLIPALIPSWRFFDIIAPSPRIQFKLQYPGDDCLSGWREFRPRPARISILRMLGRMFWNPGWNESLYLVSCAERLLEQSDRHGEDEILRRITSELTRGGNMPLTATHLQFRLLLIRRAGGRLEQEIAYLSRISILSHRDAV